MHGNPGRQMETSLQAGISNDGYGGYTGEERREDIAPGRTSNWLVDGRQSELDIPGKRVHHHSFEQFLFQVENEISPEKIHSRQPMQSVIGIQAQAITARYG